jgi:hypothetical protein
MYKIFTSMIFALNNMRIVYEIMLTLFQNKSIFLIGIITKIILINFAKPMTSSINKV